MKKIICLLAVLAPTAAFAADRTFECVPEKSPLPELTAKLVKFGEADKGQITVDGTEMEAQVFGSLGGFNFLHIGDGYTMSYDVNIEEGTVKYSASGSKNGHGSGTCSEL
ncbi:hypothetical protein ROA7450_02544 [Roseovarius albus]|uniref:Uncharacterized protein n=1 Tax=Roseovarius albus TaxID=1247867 RepID=A0A1X6ZH62_9RHOB|nr:hypothetical protein [Roseovarius albus]SLN50969.1 hypothetical protein ROA7450_02544 [Roseovarius albus]